MKYYTSSQLKRKFMKNPVFRFWYWWEKKVLDYKISQSDKALLTKHKMDIWWAKYLNRRL